MISKELLSKVLEYKVFDVLTERLPNNCLFYRTNDEATIRRYSPYLPSINIYELAHKCKEWASINSYALESSVHMQPKRSSVAGCQIHWRYETEDLPYFEADTEPEAIFKACEWILDKDSK